ncbi:hypothetical protein C3L33_12721, partial [Rhododendron williamsianum]
MSTSAAVAVEVLPRPQKGVWRVKLVIANETSREFGLWFGCAEEGEDGLLGAMMKLEANGCKFVMGNGDHQSRELSPDFCISSPSKGKVANELKLAT